MYGALWRVRHVEDDAVRRETGPCRDGFADRPVRRLEEPAQVEPDECDALAVRLEDDRGGAERIPDLGDRREQAKARRRPERLGDVATGKTGPQRHRVSSDGSKRSEEPVGRQPRISLAGVVSRQRVLFSEIASKIPNLTSAGADRQRSIIWTASSWARKPGKCRMSIGRFSLRTAPSRMTSTLIGVVSENQRAAASPNSLAAPYGLSGRGGVR